MTRVGSQRHSKKEISKFEVSSPAMFSIHVLKDVTLCWTELTQRQNVTSQTTLIHFHCSADTRSRLRRSAFIRSAV
jgi:hypothetical protein